MLNWVYTLILTTWSVQILQSVAEPGIDLEGRIFQDKGKTIYMFFCSTNETFLGCTVEFLLDNTTFDDIRYEDNHCHHKGGICDPKRCTCSRACTLFMWTFLSNSSEMNHTFGCQSRLSVDSYIYKANIYIRLSKGEFVTFNRTINPIIRRHSTNELQTSQEPRLLEQKKMDPKDWINSVSVLVTGIGIIIIIIILLVNKINCSNDQRNTQGETASKGTETASKGADIHLNDGKQPSTVNDYTASNEETPQSTVDDSDTASNEETEPLIPSACQHGQPVMEMKMVPIYFFRDMVPIYFLPGVESINNESEV